VIRKLVVVLLAGVLCLLTARSVLGFERHIKVYNSPRNYTELTGEKIERFNEAHSLKVKVAAGELPPIEERLPEKPLVIEPFEKIGYYGGMLNTGTTWSGGYWIMGGAESGNLLGFDYDTAKVIPSILEKWEISEDAKTFTLYLRKGIKWSDGAPFTTNDVLFQYEDVLMNKKLTPVFPSKFVVNEKPMKLEAIDDYTFRISFAAPYGAFPLMLYDYIWSPEWFKPKHHMKNFHPRYTSLENLEPLIKKAGFGKGEWWRLFLEMDGSNTWSLKPVCINFPRLSAWIMTDKPKPGITVFERNPYYWKVDCEGNQLPYIDKIRVELMSNPEVITMKILNGELNYQFELGIPNYPLFKENEERGGYRLLPLRTDLGTKVHYHLNLTYPDLGWRKIVQDKRFRIALSLGIDREKINDVVFLGLARPAQSTISTTSAFMEPEFITSYAQYDPKKANQLLDEMGLDKRDKEGWRLRPDGKRLTLPIDYQPQHELIEPTTEIVAKNWRELGIETSMKFSQPSLWGELQAANQIAVGVLQHCHAIDDNFIIVPVFEVPYEVFASFAPLWTLWYTTEGEKGEEPPAEIKRLFELRKIMLTTPSEKERSKAAKEILRSQAENLWHIGTVCDQPNLSVVAKNLQNCPENQEEYFAEWLQSNANQLFFER